MSRYSRENMQKCRRNEQIFEGKYAKMSHFIFIKKTISDCNQQIFEGKFTYVILLYSFLKSGYTFEKTIK